MKVDCLIINPSALSAIYQGLSSELAAIEPPIWAGLLANAVRAQGKSVAIIDAEAHGMDARMTANKAYDYDARLIVIVVYGQQPSASTQNMHAAIALVKELAGDTPVLLVGGHVSALPEESLRESGATFVAKGEGIQTILDLLECGEKFYRVRGLYWMDDKTVCTSNLPATTTPQADLPSVFPGVAWDLLPMEKYRAHNWHAFDHIDQRQPYASLYTSLGCPFRCTFCCINAPFGGSSFRYWEVEHTLKEFDVLARNYGVKNIKIADEMFVLKKDHFLKIAEGLIDRQYGLNIWAYARVDTVKPEHLATLKKAGVNWLALGIESGSKFVRDGVQKGRFDGLDIKSVVTQIKDAGIHVIGNYIFGLPDDDFRTMNETLDLALDLNCEMSNFYSAMAYPGSKLYEIAKEKGWPLPKSWLGYSQHSFECLPMRTDTLSASAVLGFRDYAFHKYFTSERYLSMVRAKFGEKTYEHIREMVKHHLKREHSFSFLAEESA